MAGNQHNVTEWSDISTRGLLLKSNQACWSSTKRSGHHHHPLIEI